MSAYITSTGMYLPGDPIDNETIESVLGMVHDKPSRLRKKILSSNGIKTRHYAMDRNQQTIISNSEMASRASVCSVVLLARVIWYYLVLAVWFRPV